MWPHASATTSHADSPPTAGVHVANDGASAVPVRATPMATAAMPSVTVSPGMSLAGLLGVEQASDLNTHLVALTASGEGPLVRGTRAQLTRLTRSAAARFRLVWGDASGRPEGSVDAERLWQRGSADAAEWVREKPHRVRAVLAVERPTQHDELIFLFRREATVAAPPVAVHDVAAGVVAPLSPHAPAPTKLPASGRGPGSASAGGSGSGRQRAAAVPLFSDWATLRAFLDGGVTVLHATGLRDVAPLFDRAASARLGEREPVDVAIVRPVGRGRGSKVPFRLYALRFGALFHGTAGDAFPCVRHDAGEGMWHLGMRDKRICVEGMSNTMWLRWDHLMLMSRGDKNMDEEAAEPLVLGDVGFPTFDARRFWRLHAMLQHGTTLDDASKADYERMESSLAKLRRGTNSNKYARAYGMSERKDRMRAMLLWRDEIDRMVQAGDSDVAIDTELLLAGRTRANVALTPAERSQLDELTTLWNGHALGRKAVLVGADRDLTLFTSIRYASPNGHEMEVFQRHTLPKGATLKEVLVQGIHNTYTAAHMESFRRVFRDEDVCLVVRKRQKVPANRVDAKDPRVRAPKWAKSSRPAQRVRREPRRTSVLRRVQIVDASEAAAGAAEVAAAAAGGTSGGGAMDMGEDAILFRRIVSKKRGGRSRR